MGFQIEWGKGMRYDGWSGKQKYEQLVEVKLSLEMEISTYRSILEDEEKRIKRCQTTESCWQHYFDIGKNKIQTKY